MRVSSWVVPLLGSAWKVLTVLLLVIRDLIFINCFFNTNDGSISTAHGSAPPTGTPSPSPPVNFSNHRRGVAISIRWRDLAAPLPPHVEKMFSHPNMSAIISSTAEPKPNPTSGTVPMTSGDFIHGDDKIIQCHHRSAARKVELDQRPSQLDAEMAAGCGGLSCCICRGQRCVWGDIYRSNIP